MGFTMAFTEEFEEKVSLCDSWVKELAPKGEGVHGVIFEAVNYSINAGGKRIRPVLAAAVCEMLGRSASDVKHFAAAVEFIHTYSLIHDDLPCMDDDDMRRGMPSSHIKFGEATALLAGDALLNYAFETALKAPVSCDIIVKCASIIGSAAGMDGMIGGQVIDINGARNYEELIKVHTMKTGALITAAALVGAVAGGADDSEVESIRCFAHNVGMAFQVRDDILDVEGSASVLGKKTGGDIMMGKTTFVSLFGLGGAKERLKDYTDKAIGSLEPFGERADFLTELAKYLLCREN